MKFSILPSSGIDSRVTKAPPLPCSVTIWQLRVHSASNWSHTCVLDWCWLQRRIRQINAGGSMYTYIYIHVYICTHTHVFTCMYVCMCVCTYVWQNMSLYVYIYTYIYICRVGRICVYIYMHVYIYTYMHVFIYVCPYIVWSMYICAHTYICHDDILYTARSTIDTLQCVSTLHMMKYVSVNGYIYTCIHIYKNMYTYTHTNKQTHTHTTCVCTLRWYIANHSSAFYALACNHNQ